jgi:geranylgeranyl pyrophosphate synthase
MRQLLTSSDAQVATEAAIAHYTDKAQQQLAQLGLPPTHHHAFEALVQACAKRTA